ncbi:MAG: PaaI family thioesterase [Kangiellaceae bacterium]
MSQLDLSLHYRGLERMYLAAPIDQIYQSKISISEGYSEIEIQAKKEFFHGAGAVHGSVYFKLLDDSAFFAANSLETELFVLTTSFTTYLTRPISSGNMRAVGKIANQNRSQFIAESIVYDSKDREIGRGNGVFVRSKIKLASVPGYLD